ncbi:MAG: sporulation protein [Clostridiales bacterium]|nr:sporulation protein [Clostridiales bacterium]
MERNNFNSTVESLFKGMDNFITSKTVVGDAVKLDDDTLVLPLVEVTFGVAAGAFAGETKNNAGGGMGGKITPSSVLVIQNGSSRLVNVKAQDSVNKIIDLIPDLIDKFSKNSKKKDNLEERVEDILKEQGESK